MTWSDEDTVRNNSMRDPRPILPGPEPATESTVEETKDKTYLGPMLPPDTLGPATGEQQTSDKDYLIGLVHASTEAHNTRDWDRMLNIPLLESATIHLQMHSDTPMDMSSVIEHYKRHYDLFPERYVAITRTEVVFKNSNRTADVLVDLHTHGSPPGVVLPSSAKYTFRKLARGWVCTSMVSMRGASLDGGSGFMYCPDFASHGT